MYRQADQALPAGGDQAGMTMIELIVAIGIFSVLVWIGMGFFHHFEEEQRAQIAMSNAEQAANEIMTRLKRDVMGVRPNTRTAQAFATACNGATCNLTVSSGTVKYQTSCASVPPRIAAMAVGNPIAGGMCVNCGPGQMPIVQITTNDASGSTVRTYGKQAGQPASAVGVALCFQVQVLGVKSMSLNVDVNVVVPKSDALVWNYRKQQSINLSNTSGIQVYRRR